MSSTSKMKILFVTTKDPRAQGDFLEVGLLHGLRSVLGSSCIDFPRKKVMYHDWSETSKEELHGRGFTLYSQPIEELSQSEREMKDIDYVLYGVTNAYGSQEYDKINSLVGQDRVWHLDGHDLYGHAPRMITFGGEIVIGVQKVPCFKRELTENIPGALPIGFGIPKDQIRGLNFSGKSQLFQKTAPHHAAFKEFKDLGDARAHHVFTVEADYYDDLQKSWFGLTCKKGGWDCLRHYEIIAAGALLLFRDYNKKPNLCSPRELPCHSYASKEELAELISRLVVNNKPTNEYLDMLFSQRQWLYSTGTTEARALSVLRTLSDIK